MQGKRTDRVAHLIQMELGELVLSRIKDPRIGFVTITHVEVSADLRYARVFFSVIGDEQIRKETGDILQKAAGFFQKELADHIQLRNTPRLKFVYDDSVDKGFEIDRVLRNLEDEKKAP